VVPLRHQAGRPHRHGARGERVSPPRTPCASFLSSSSFGCAVFGLRSPATCSTLCFIPRGGDVDARDVFADMPHRPGEPSGGGSAFFPCLLLMAMHLVA
jgi:hypothetical protein